MIMGQTTGRKGSSLDEMAMAVSSHKPLGHGE
jgi:hypothetical protein